MVQLQQALIGLALRASAPTGVLDDETVLEVDRLYHGVGHEPPRHAGTAVLPSSEIVFADGLPRIVSRSMPAIGSRLAPTDA